MKLKKKSCDEKQGVELTPLKVGEKVNLQVMTRPRSGRWMTGEDYTILEVRKDGQSYSVSKNGEKAYLRNRRHLCQRGESMGSGAEVADSFEATTLPAEVPQAPVHHSEKLGVKKSVRFKKKSIQQDVWTLGKQVTQLLRVPRGPMVTRLCAMIRKEPEVHVATEEKLLVDSSMGFHLLEIHMPMIGIRIGTIILFILILFCLLYIMQRGCQCCRWWRNDGNNPLPTLPPPTGPIVLPMYQMPSVGYNYPMMAQPPQPQPCCFGACDGEDDDSEAGERDEGAHHKGDY